MHEYANKVSGFKIKLEGKYKTKHIRFNYVHLMEFEKTRFRFFKYGNTEGWLNYEDYKIKKKYTDPKKGEIYTIHYDGSNLRIDNNIIDVDLMLDVKNGFENSNGKGLSVIKGEIIGYTGSTGNSYQGKKINHLHFNTYINWKSVFPYEEFKDYFSFDASGVETSTKQDGVTSSSKW